MNTHSDFEGFESLDSFSVESLIAGAGNYVVATDDLRPRTIEAAKEVSQRTRRRRSLSVYFALAVVAIAVTGSSVKMHLASHSNFPKSSADVQRIALRLAERTGMSPDWALKETLEEMRQIQQQRLRLVRCE